MAQKFSSFHQLFSSIETQQTPALVWYSVPGERVELSGRVLMNWVAKTSNLLDDELDFQDVPLAFLQMGPHWRSAAIAMAVLNAGGHLFFEDDSDDRDAAVLVTDDPERATSWQGEYSLLVDRGALSPRFMGSFDEDCGIIDFCAEVRAFGDVYFPLSVPEPDMTAVGDTLHGDFLAEVAQAAADFDGQDGAAFVLPLQAAWTADSLRTFLAVVASKKTVILLDPTLDWSSDRVQRIVQDEQATVL